MASYKCTICDRQVEYEAALPAAFPFCSPRCRMADLGRWFRGQYSIERALGPDELSTDAEVETARLPAQRRGHFRTDPM